MIYINGTSCISPQLTFGNDHFLTDVKQYNSNMLQCIEPDYSKFFNANALRRISRVIKLGWAGAKACLDDAGLAAPNAICVGTGKGCYKNTQQFLFSVDENEEQFVPPSPFIQSAHGSIAAQIAIQTGCKNHNMTYAHRSFSFESALLDVMMLYNENIHKNILVGGVDEIEAIQFSTFDRIGHYKKPGFDNLQLFLDHSPGTIAGEGSTFFVCSAQPDEKTLACINDVHTFSNPQSPAGITSQIQSFLHRRQLTVDDIDLVVFGLNGDTRHDGSYHRLMQTLFIDKCQAAYKHLCGEYHTSTAFALWMSAHIIHRHEIPEVVKLNTKTCDPIKHVLIYNHYRNINHSLMLVSDHRNKNDGAA